MTSPRYRIVALHGFLGSAADWEPFRLTCAEGEWEPLDLWSLFSHPRVSDWPSIGEAVGSQLRAACHRDALPVFLVGYSLGARLALSVPDLGAAGSPVAGACLVSCNPGLPADDEGARAARKAADEAWAAKFIDAPINHIWKEWDAQPVFAGSAVPRREARLPGPRVTIARAMRVASLATQPDRRAMLRAWQKPLLWVTGERDSKFRATAASLAAEGVPARFVTIEHSGHRVPWDNPAAFSRTLQEWIDEVLATRGSA